MSTATPTTVATAPAILATSTRSLTNTGDPVPATFRSLPASSFPTAMASGSAALILPTSVAKDAALGSYTTFSTWMLETQRLGEDGDYTPMIANAIASLACGVGAAALGRALGGAL